MNSASYDSASSSYSKVPSNLESDRTACSDHDSLSTDGSDNDPDSNKLETETDIGPGLEPI